MLITKKIILTLMFGFLTSLFGYSQNKTQKLVLIAENYQLYYDKGVELIKPYLILLGEAYRLEKNGAAKLLEGIKYLDAATQINPNNFAPFWFKGKAYQALNQNDDAYYQFKKSFELNKDNPDVARELALECMSLGKGQEAVDFSLHALKLNEKDAGLVCNLALAYLFNGDLDMATKTVDKAILADPSDQINHNLKKIVDEVISGKRARPKKYSDLK